MKVGVTDDGRAVVDQCFRFYDTHGVPLADILRVAKEEGVVVSVPHLVLEAAKAGWSKARIRAWLEDGFLDAHGPAFTAHVMQKFDARYG